MLQETRYLLKPKSMGKRFSKYGASYGPQYRTHTGKNGTDRSAAYFKKKFYSGMKQGTSFSIEAKTSLTRRNTLEKIKAWKKGSKPPRVQRRRPNLEKMSA